MVVRRLCRPSTEYFVFCPAFDTEALGIPNVYPSQVTNRSSCGYSSNRSTAASSRVGSTHGAGRVILATSLYRICSLKILTRHSVVSVTSTIVSLPSATRSSSVGSCGSSGLEHDIRLVRPSRLDSNAKRNSRRAGAEDMLRFKRLDMGLTYHVPTMFVFHVWLTETDAEGEVKRLPDSMVLVLEASRTSSMVTL